MDFPVVGATTNWEGIGSFGGLGDVEETTEISNISVSMFLSGIPAELAQHAQDQDYYRRPATIFFGVMNTALGALIGGVPTVIWSGYIDVMELAFSGDSFTILLEAESEDADFERPNGTLYSNTQQQNDFPGDRAYDLLELMENISLLWPGGNSVSYGTKGEDHAYGRGFGGFV